ncbi:MAG: hypothetical protein QNJ22_07410 [Desulfosarcinaceae bacterium]|nr:hypothetical protein [Desulfosarcinaceae bacterium]
MSVPPPITKLFTRHTLYRALLFLCALTGFGQMPIYKRYYLADIPGFGWLADFYVTRFVHYLGAALLLGLLAYTVADYLMRRRSIGSPSWSAWVRSALLATIVTSGIFFVAKNLAGAYFPPTAIIVGNLLHLGAVMGLLAVSSYCLLFGKGWTSDPGIHKPKRV